MTSSSSASGPRTATSRRAPRRPAVTDKVEFTTRIDDVEWRGSTQLAYLGFEIDPEVEERLIEVEDLLDFDLFQSFLVAELAADELAAARHVDPRRGPARKVHVFDPETGENLTLPSA